VEEPLARISHEEFILVVKTKGTGYPLFPSKNEEYNKF
jgi:hypothetical protein